MHPRPFPRHHDHDIYELVSNMIVFAQIMCSFNFIEFIMIYHDVILKCALCMFLVLNGKYIVFHVNCLLRLNLEVFLWKYEYLNGCISSIHTSV